MYTCFWSYFLYILNIGGTIKGIDFHYTSFAPLKSMKLFSLFTVKHLSALCSPKIWKYLKAVTNFSSFMSTTTDLRCQFMKTR